jgi:AraC-like DNA-binding protein
MDKLNNFKKLIFNVFLISFILGTAIAYYLSYHNTKPLNNILKQIKDFMGEDETESREDAFNTINTTISSLISSNNSLQEKLKEQKPMILAAFIERLLKGEYNNRGEIEATSSYVGINFESSQYIVLVLRVYGRNDFNNINEEIVQELNTVKIILKEAIDRHLTNRGYYNDIDAQSIALILCIDKNDNYKHEIEITIQKIYKDLSERYSLKILFGIGNMCKSSLEIWRSYQEALEAVNCIPHHDQEISKWYLDIPKEGQIYYYPIEFEQRIINCCKSSDVEQIKILFDILYEENFMKRILTMNMYKQLFYELKSTMIKLAQQVSEDGSLLKQLEDLSFSKSINEDFQCIFKEYINICAYIAESKNNKSLCLTKKITSFIDENYMIKDLGLPLVASEFNFSEGYLSYFFKEQTGKNFSDYVEQIRMTKAHKLLESSTISINDIAEKVGYSNVQSFRRAFKRVEGVSPSMLRK